MAALVVLGFLLRTTNAADVFVGGAVVYPGNDPYYQAHRVFQALGSYPWVPLVDPLLDHPYGAAPIWPPVFPWLLATLAWALGLDTTRAVETLLAVSTPLVGASICIPVYGLARRILDAPWAWLAAALSVSIPAHLWYSRLGFVDHHAAVTLVQVSMFLGGLRAMREGRAGLLVASTAVGMLLWNGFILFVGLLDGWLLAVFALGGTATRRRVGEVVAWSHGAAALALVPLALATARATGAPWGTFAVSYLHVVALAAVAVVGVAIARRPEKGWIWIVAAVAVGIVAGIASGGLTELGTWVFGRDAFMSSIQEVVPIFLRSDGTLDLGAANIWLTRFWLVVPLLLVSSARRSFAAGRADSRWLLLTIWGTGLFVLALRQRRFAESFAPALAVLAAFGVRGIYVWVRTWLAWGLTPSTSSAGAALVAALALVLGIGPYYGPIVRDPSGLLAIAHASVPAPEPRLPPETHTNLLRLRDLAPTRRGEGVLNLWPLGHRVLYLTHLPVLASPFGSHLGGTSFDEASALFLEEDEASVVRRMTERRLRWVVVDADLGTIGASLRARGASTRDYYAITRLPTGEQRIEHRPALLRTLYGRLAVLAGAGAEGAAEPLRHFRLVVDAQRDHTGGHPRVFERVEGARLRLRGRPGTTYELEYRFVSSAGRERRYAVAVRTDPGGGAEVVLPYSSDRPDLGHDSRWRVTGPGAAPVASLRIPEAAVLRGEVLDADLG